LPDEVVFSRRSNGPLLPFLRALDCGSATESGLWETREVALLFDPHQLQKFAQQKMH
jgi:hypothetical protein